MHTDTSFDRRGKKKKKAKLCRVMSGIIDPLSEKPERVDNKQQHSISTPYHRYEYCR